MTDRRLNRIAKISAVMVLSIVALVGGAAAILAGAAAPEASTARRPAGGQSGMTVSNSQQLLAALKANRGGGTILLAPGVYDPIVIARIAFTRPVVITSRDRANPAVLTGLAIAASSGVRFQNVVLSTERATRRNTFQITGSSGVHLDRVSVHGSLDGDPSNDTTGIAVRQSRDISVTNSEFQQLQWAISLIDSENLTISGNSFHDIRVDGVRGGGSSNVVVSRNHFTDFYRAEGDHPDAIQFWTANSTTAAHDITVSENVIIRGAGGTMQGIFITDQKGLLPFRDVKITGNLVLGGAYNGIAVSNIDKLEISNNTVAGYDDKQSWIRLEKTRGGLLTGNSLTKLVDRDNQGLIQRGNQIIETQPPEGGALKGWLGVRAAEIDRFPPGVIGLFRRHVAAAGR